MSDECKIVCDRLRQHIRGVKRNAARDQNCRAAGTQQRERKQIATHLHAKHNTEIGENKSGITENKSRGLGAMTIADSSIDNISILANSICQKSRPMSIMTGTGEHPG